MPIIAAVMPMPIMGDPFGSSATAEAVRRSFVPVLFCALMALSSSGREVGSDSWVACSSNNTSGFLSGSFFSAVIEKRENPGVTAW